MERVAHLFFDLGGTLVDLRGLVPSMASQILARYPELDARAEAIAFSWSARTAAATSRAVGPAFRSGFVLTGDALVAALADAGIQADFDTAIALVKSATMDFVGDARLFADVSPRLLRSLRSRVSSMGIVTDSVDFLVRALMSNLHLHGLFDVVVISESMRTYKPDPRIYRAALEEACAEPQTSVFVSDSVIDLQGAARVGMGTAWIRRGSESLRSEPPRQTIIISSLGELAEALAIKGSF